MWMAERIFRVFNPQLCPVSLIAVINFNLQNEIVAIKPSKALSDEWEVTSVGWVIVG